MIQSNDNEIEKIGAYITISVVSAIVLTLIINLIITILS